MKTEPSTIPEFVKSKPKEKFPPNNTGLGSFVKYVIMIPVFIGLVAVVFLMMLGWIYEGPRRLIVKVLKKGKERIRYEVQ